MSIGATVEASYSAVTASIGGDYNRSSVNEEMKEDIQILARGGSAQYINKSIIASEDNAQYNRWVETIGDKPTLVDFDEDSLMPIWELAEANSPRQAEIKQAVLQMIERKQSEIPEGNGNALMMADTTFYVRSKSDGRYWDLSGYHFDAQGLRGKISLCRKDDRLSGYQGADRFIKVIPHSTDFEYVYLQPQHGDHVITTHDSQEGYNVQLWNWRRSNEAQQFRMVAVNGEADTYFLISRRSGMYLTQTDGDVTQAVELNGTDKERQKWVFEFADGREEMAPPDTSHIYAIKNIMAGRFIDIGGSPPNQGGKRSIPQLWNMGRSSAPDYYMRLIKMEADPMHFYVQPKHGLNVWDIQGQREEDRTPLHLWNINNGANQQFRFLYAGSPMTYNIQNRMTGKFVTINPDKSDEQGAKLFIQTFNGGTNQQWRMFRQPKIATVPTDQNFLIRAPYANTYWDLPGRGNETNEKGRNFQMWNRSYGNDRIFRFLDSGENIWRKIQVQNGGRFVDVQGASNASGAAIHLWDGHGGKSQKFAIELTSHNTFVLLTRYWRAVNIAGGTSEDWMDEGQALKQYPVHYGPNQHFQLEYADGPNKGEIYQFFDPTEF